MNTDNPIKTQQVLSGIWHATYGDYDLGDPIGTGFSEQEAVEDLRERVEQMQDAVEAKSMMEVLRDLPIIGVINVDNPRDPRHKDWKR